MTVITLQRTVANWGRDDKQKNSISRRLTRRKLILILADACDCHVTWTRAEIKPTRGSAVMSARDATRCCSRGQAPSSTATWQPEAATHVRGNVSPDWAEVEAEPETGRATAGNGSYFTMGADKSHTHSATRQRQRGNKLVKGSLLIEIAAWRSSRVSPSISARHPQQSDVTAIMTCPDTCVSESPSPMNRPVSSLYSTYVRVYSVCYDSLISTRI